MSKCVKCDEWEAVYCAICLSKEVKEARKDERQKIIERLQKHFEARKQQSEKLGRKYNLGRSVGIGECMRIIKKEMSKNDK